MNATLFKITHKKSDINKKKWIHLITFYFENFDEVKKILEYKKEYERNNNAKTELYFKSK